MILERDITRLLYLNDAQKVRNALIYDFGKDVPMPSMARIQRLLDARRLSAERLSKTASGLNGRAA